MAKKAQKTVPATSTLVADLKASAKDAAPKGAKVLVAPVKTTKKGKVTKAAVARAVKSVTPKEVTKTKAFAPKYDVSQKIQVLVDTNPRREGLPPYERFEALRKSKTVGDFLKKYPEWRATIARAVKENLIKVLPVVFAVMVIAAQ
jgi:hypothetical protein